MSLVKYRIREVAADFGVAPKEIVEIISKFFEKPKSNTQVLTEEELNVVFDIMTQTHQISSLEQVFAVQPKPAPKAEASKAEPAKSVQAEKPAQTAAKPQNAPSSKQPQPPKAEKPKEPERKRERRIVDTSAVQVNTNRFADVDNLVSERVQNFQGGKQRIGGGKGKQQQKQQKNNFKGNKSRNEEQEKMRRLQMEVARKAPVTVKIPDGGCAIIEGLHALNPLLTDGLATDLVTKVFVSVSTNISIGDDRILSGRKIRFIRRMSRDYLYRAADAARTLSFWQGVLAGEDKYLYPYKETADIRFDTFHFYEIGVMKRLATQVMDESPALAEHPFLLVIRRALSHFPCIPLEMVPETSLLREFLPGGIYEHLY